MQLVEAQASTEILGYLPKGGAMTILVVLVILTWGPMAIFSKASAEKLWLLGRFVRFVNSRKERAIERETRLESQTARSLREEIAGIRDDLERSRLAVEKLEQKVETQTEYLGFVYEWSREVRLMAKEYGWHPPLPEWVTMKTWLARTHSAWRGEEDEEE